MCTEPSLKYTVLVTELVYSGLAMKPPHVLSTDQIYENIKRTYMRIFSFHLEEQARLPVYRQLRPAMTNCCV